VEEPEAFTRCRRVKVPCYAEGEVTFDTIKRQRSDVQEMWSMNARERENSILYTALGEQSSTKSRSAEASKHM